MPVKRNVIIINFDMDLSAVELRVYVWLEEGPLRTRKKKEKPKQKYENEIGSIVIMSWKSMRRTFSPLSIHQKNILLNRKRKETSDGILPGRIHKNMLRVILNAYREFQSNYFLFVWHEVYVFEGRRGQYLFDPLRR